MGGKGARLRHPGNIVKVCCPAKSRTLTPALLDCILSHQILHSLQPHMTVVAENGLA